MVSFTYLCALIMPFISHFLLYHFGGLADSGGAAPVSSSQFLESEKGS